MRIIRLNEFEVECPNCKALLAATSEDVHTTLGGALSYVKCPVCNNPILVNIEPV